MNDEYKIIIYQAGTKKIKATIGFMHNPIVAITGAYGSRFDIASQSEKGYVFNTYRRAVEFCCRVLMPRRFVKGIRIVSMPKELPVWEHFKTAHAMEQINIFSWRTEK